jgi:cystathionine gamma-synthase
MDEKRHQGRGTASVWAGEKKRASGNPTQVPIVQSVSFGYDDVEEWIKVGRGSKPGHIYSRNTNPTLAAFEEKVRILEGAQASTSFSSGMAAISNTLFTLLSPGDRVVSIKDSYGGTGRLFLEFLPRFGIEATLCETTDHAQIEKEVKKGCRVLYLESPTNPTLKVVDIARLAQAAHDTGAVVVVDNTFATPINQQPLSLGADLVVHSATKFLGGHADALGGVVCGPEKLVKEIYHFREINGAALDPVAAYLLIRGMKTLHLRIARQNESANTIARHLERHRAVKEVSTRALKATGPRHCEKTDVWVRRRAELHPEGRPGCREDIPASPAAGPPAGPTWAPWRPLQARPPPRATWSAPPKSAPLSGSPKGSCAIP